MSETFVRQMPMRWADLDSLNHVNNVVYLDYAAEARAVLADERVLGADRPIARMKVEFLRPLLLSRAPVSVVSTLDDSKLVQEICIDREDKRTVFSRVTTTFEKAPTVPGAPDDAPIKPIRIRRSDLDPNGTVSTTKVFELFQEGRILRLSELLTGMSPGRFVVAMVDVTFGEPISWRPEPYETHSWISRVGGSSFTIDAEINDGATVHAHATSVLVGFDLPTQKSRPLNSQEVTELSSDLKI